MNTEREGEENAEDRSRTNSSSKKTSSLKMVTKSSSNSKVKSKKKNPKGEKTQEKVRLTTEKQSVFNVIEQEMNNLNDIGHDIWRYAEPGGKEHQSCKRIVDFLKNKGFYMNPVCNDFDTAFRAEFGSGEVGGKNHPNIAFLCEYNADPQRGHSRGHNLLSATSLAAAIGLQRVIGFSKKPLGKVTVIGCPSNENRTFKKELLAAGCFNGIDFVLTAYPANFTCLQPKFLAQLKLRTTFHGRTAGLNPWEGANPINGIVLTQQGLAAHRQTFSPGWQIDGMVPCIGEEPCENPTKASLVYELKASTNVGIKVLNEKLHLCLEGASTASGCKFEEKVIDQPMVPNINCPGFVELYRKNAKLNGFTFHDERTDVMMEPDDISFISHNIPTFKLYYYAGTSAAHGTDEFNRYSGSTEAEYMNIVQGKSLAMMATDIFLDNEVLQGITNKHGTDAAAMNESSFLDN